MTRAGREKTDRSPNTKTREATSTERQSGNRHRMDRPTEEAGTRAQSGPERAVSYHPLLQLQRTRGNQAVQSLSERNVLPKLEIDSPNNRYEREADRVADQVMRMPSGEGGDTVADTARRVRSLRSGGGQPLPASERAFFEPRFGTRFDEVRIHTGPQAQATAAALGARAFTVGHDVVFGTRQYTPGTTGGRRLMAHELTHVVQQSGGQNDQRSNREDAAGGIQRLSAAVPNVQRVVELRPPGQGEASAFGRRQELVDRLNAQSEAIQYRLERQVLRYQIINEGNLTNFDRQMQRYIDRNEVVPMRLVTGAGYVRGQSGRFEPLVHDSWVHGYVDLDDLLASDEPGFQSQLVHFLTERFATRGYERRIGTRTFSLGEFNRVHHAGYEAEAELFRDMVGDSTIRYLYSELRPNGTWVVAFQSDERYRIFKTFRGARQEVRGAEVWVQTGDGRRMTIDELRAERNNTIE